VQGYWAEADILSASSRILESMIETSKIYDSSNEKVSIPTLVRSYNARLSVFAAIRWGVSNSGRHRRGVV